MAADFTIGGKQHCLRTPIQLLHEQCQPKSQPVWFSSQVMNRLLASVSLYLYYICFLLPLFSFQSGVTVDNS